MPPRRQAFVIQDPVAVANRLPDDYLIPLEELTGSVENYRDYLSHIREEVEGYSDDSVIEVLQVLGVDPGSWYRGKQPTPPDWA